MRLHGYKVFPVEDEPLIGMDLAMSLEDAGADVEGSVAPIEDAMSRLKDSSIDSRRNVALLDYRLGTSTSEPIARCLRDMSIPIVFYTGSIQGAQPIADECHCRILTKPSTEAMIVQALLDAITGSQAMPPKEQAATPLNTTANKDPLAERWARSGNQIRLIYAILYGQS